MNPNRAAPERVEHVANSAESKGRVNVLVVRERPRHILQHAVSFVQTTTSLAIRRQ